MAKPPETDRRDWLWTIITTKKHKIMTRNNITTLTNTRIYGLRSFTNPSEAWNVVCSNWTCNEDKLLVLNDEKFKKMVVERVIIKVVECKLGLITYNQCKDVLGFSESGTNYLIDFNFFMYCNKTRKFYTSIVHYNNTHWPGLGSVEWKVYEELSQVYDFEYLVQTGMDFVDSNSYLFNQYGEDALDKFIDKWWYS